ncbi:ribosomal RNA small subunit methyltransferase I [Geotalea uraniireducens]|uniref:Ribosomal RNA small subunit methyltransferase I n=1 Tax=Geotalea uraniireducens TaxID=351604 RepID=A0ABM8EIJ9_9BACT|nr:16S rRNA (cytidine(1402)-2'-O)-methyltransferase [Geotalea uraniireducens]BDV41783.1 ribosomal RNA small subunit methyltransferase I [Geotalea uraniireducens]
MNPGTLYVVATPVGNLEDITFRAVRILKEVDLIAAEDTRHTRKLLQHFGIAKQLTSYFDHNKNLKGEYILGKLAAGQAVALVSDAGTPCISDPGYQLVRDAAAAGVPIVPIAGPCAAIAALSASGLPSDAFVFEGFLPSRRKKRLDKLASLKNEERLLILYESPKRLQDLLGDMLEVFGERQIVVARELSKVYEEFVRGSIAEVIASFAGREVRGELVVLVAAASSVAGCEGDSVEALLERYLFAEKLSVKDAVKRVSLQLDLPRSDIYDQALRLKHDAE